MPIRTPLIVSALAIVAMLVITAWGWSVTLPGARVVIHWSIINGQPDGFLPRAYAFFFLPLIAVALSAVYAVFPNIEPRRANLRASRKPFFASWYGSLAIFTALHAVLVMHAAGSPLDAPRWILLAAALMLTVLGNFLGKSRSNFFIGMRSPWSLSSNDAWEKSNRVSGHWLVATGVVTMAVVVLTDWRTGIATLMIGAVLSAVAGIVTSYIAWKRDPHRQTVGTVGEDGSVHE